MSWLIIHSLHRNFFAFSISGMTFSTSSLVILPNFARLYSPLAFLFSLEICSLGVPLLYANTDTAILLFSNSSGSENNSLSKLLSNPTIVIHPRLILSLTLKRCWCKVPFLFNEKKTHHKDFQF